MSDNTITVLGHTFSSEEERREYFREELRKKLPELKQMEGFPIGEDEDIIKLSDPPYYTACPNPWLNDFIAEWEEEKKQLEKEGKRSPDFQVDTPYASDVSEGKNNPIYRAHSYHTKVPHPVIVKYLQHYTQKGDVILDGFQGTGMTGVAAKQIASSNGHDLKYIGFDLSPIANFIAYNFNSPWNLVEIRKEFQEILNEVNKELDWMYQTYDAETKTNARINYVIWSDTFDCPNCQHEDSYWNYAFDIVTESVKSEFECPNCSILLNKKQLSPGLKTRLDSDLNKPIIQINKVPVIIDYTNKKGKRNRKIPDEKDLEILSKIESGSFDLSYPTFELMGMGDRWGDTWRKGSHTGITHVHHFFERRTLIALASLYSKFRKHQFSSNLLFFLTSILAMRCTRRMPYRSGGKSAGSVNNMMLPSISQEYNVFDTISRKYKDIEKAKLHIPIRSSNSLIGNQSATELKNIADSSIDYIFLDPPFGSNIMYSEMSFISESWLKVMTNNKMEAIENVTQKKTSVEYQHLMSSSFAEFFRVLKPGKWMTVEFSNTSAITWNVLQYSIQNAGFIIAIVTGIDKKQGSFKAVTTATAVKQDLVISCYKPTSKFDEKFRQHQGSEVGVWDFVDEHLHHLPIHLVKDNATTSIIERSPKILFDRLVAFYVQRALPVPIDAGKFQKGLRERFVERDGMFFTHEQVAEYDQKKSEVPEFVQLSILVASEQDGVLWLRNLLKDNPQTYQQIQPKWMQALAGLRKGDILPELIDILRDNFIENDHGQWSVPDPENEADLEKVRNRRLLKEFETYRTEAAKSRGKIKEARVEALRAGFKESYQQKDFKTIVQVGDKIPNNLLMEDEVLLQFYDIASTRV